MGKVHRSRFLKVAVFTALVFGVSSFVLFSLAGAQELSKLGLAVPHLTKLVQFGPVVVGVESGFFKQHGFDMKVIETGGGGDVARIFSASKDIDVMIGSPASTVKAILKGEKWKAVSSVYIASTTWYVLKDSPIKTVQDLRGKKVGVTRAGSLTHLEMLNILEKEGISLNDVELVFLGGLPEVLTGIKAGIVSTGPLNDPFAAKLRMTGEMRIILDSIDYLPELGGGWFVVKESSLKEKPELIKKWLLTFEEAAKFFIDEKNRQKVAEYYSKGTKFPVAVTLKTLEDASGRTWNLRFTPEMLRLVEGGMRRFKMIKEPVPWSKIIDQSYLPESYRITLPK